MSSIAQSGAVVGATVKFAIALLVSVVLMAATAGSAQAKHGHRHWHAHHRAPVAATQLVAQEPSSLGRMRYYGGPKSPMWRSPAAN